MARTREGVVSVVLVNFRGVADTLRAVEELGELDWPADRLEIVVVENASGDDSLERLRTLGSRVTLVVSKENLGFAGGCNLGISRSSGEYVALLNNDARPDPRWIAEAVAAFDSSPKIGAVASKVLDWDGKRVDFVDSSLTWYGMGFKPRVGEVYRNTHEEQHNVLFGTGAAMFVRRTVFDALEGFDERYFMFFEDVDLGWRLNLAGWWFTYVPTSIAYHKHHASMRAFGQFKEHYLLERNALFTLYKNLGDTALDKALPAALALSVRRGVARGGLDSTALDLRIPGGDSEPATPVAKDALASLYAIDQFVEALPSLEKSREKIQSTRVVSDQALRRLVGKTDVPGFKLRYYEEGYENIVHAFDVLQPEAQRKILIVTGDPIGTKMAGPAIRAWNMATALSAEHDVTLLSLSTIEPLASNFSIRSIRPGDDRAFRVFEQWADIIVFQGHALEYFASLRKSRKYVVADIYDPMHFEQLEQAHEHPEPEWKRHVEAATISMNEQLAQCDFFLCASDRQRFLYLGQLAALGRINVANYAHDPQLDGLLAVVPFGMEEDAPKHTRKVLKGVHPAIGARDKVILWGGGLYNWFDPETLIRAVAGLAERRPNVRLFFQGTKHPHPGVPEMGVVARSRELARELGVYGTQVIFNDSWVDYADRQNYLVEADAGVSAHFDHVETTFSFRTRILDYLWGGLPMVVTEGDSFADLIMRENLGVVVPERDPGALADALERVLYDVAFIAETKANIARVRADFVWSKTLEPLLEYARSPHRAPDLLGASKRGASAPRARYKLGWQRDIQLVWQNLRTGGPRVVLEKIRNRITLRLDRAPVQKADESA